MFVVYQAYGMQDVIEQTQFSVLSLLNAAPNSPDLKAMIYTDQPDHFEAFFEGSNRVEIVPTPMAQFKEWRGKIDFVHRVKLEVLKAAAKRFTGPLLYCDGDTYFLKDPSQLFSRISDKVSLMHLAEAELGKGRDPLTKKICKFAKNNSFQLDGKAVPLSPATVMWNAGVIGISENNKKLLDEMLSLTDMMYPIYPKHVIEQLAVSIVLHWRTEVEASDSSIYHYWNQKPEYQSEIKRFISKHHNVRLALQNFNDFQFPKPPEEKPRRSIIQKLFSLRP